ncbi:DMT family transporter [Acetobacter sp.]|uniref:DMT family transporter n=1 Tax=Acetobacter sp. TaxID=440 RepID=UPI0039EB46EB
MASSVQECLADTKSVSTGFRERRLYGVVLITLSTVLWSTAGFFVRELNMDVWSTVAWRSLFGFMLLFPLSFILRGRALLRLRDSVGLGGLLSIPIMAVSVFGYVQALQLTSVANVMVVYATVPFLAAGLAFVVLGERPGLRSLCAAGVAIAGVVIMVGSATSMSDLAGNLFAFVMTLGFAASMVIARRWTGYDAMLVTALSSGFGAIVCFGAAFVTLPSVPMPTMTQLALLFVFSLATQSVSYLFFLEGSRHVPSSEAGLITLLDVVLGPLWVWLVFGEKPATPALIGGALVLLSVVGYLVAAPRARSA